MTKHQIWKFWFFIWLVSTTIATLGISLIGPKAFLWGNLLHCAVVLAIPIVYLESCHRLVVYQEPLPMKHLAILTVLLYTLCPFWIPWLLIWHWSGYTVITLDDKIPQDLIAIGWFSLLSVFTLPSGLILLIAVIFHKSQ